MRRRLLLTCAAVCLQQSIANAQCPNCGTEPPTYFYVLPVQEPYYFQVPSPQPMYSSVDSWNIGSPCEMNSCGSDSAIDYEPCSPDTSTYPIFKPVRSVDEFGNVIIRLVPEQRKLTYTTAAANAEVVVKGDPLILDNVKPDKMRTEAVLLTVMEAVTRTPNLRLDKACLEKGTAVVYFFHPDETPGRVQAQIVNNTLELTAGTTPLHIGLTYDASSTRAKSEDVVKTVRSQVASLLGVPEK